MENFDAIIVGAGQAGLAVSHELNAAGIEHVVLERGRIGTTWRPLGLTSAPIGLRSLTPSPPSLPQMDLYAYRNERALPAGGVLGVGEDASIIARHVDLALARSGPRSQGKTRIVRVAGKQGFEP